MSENIYEKDIRATITDEIQRNKYVLSRIIYFIDKICNKYNINYSVSYGTLLGAVREKDVITWDIDGDVLMDEDSYLFFLEKAQSELPSGMFLQSNKTDPLFSQRSTISRIVDYYSEVNPTSSRRICPNGIHCDIHCVMTSKEKYYEISKHDNIFFFIKKIFIGAVISLGYLLTSLDFKRAFIQFFGYNICNSFETVFMGRNKYYDENCITYDAMNNEYMDFRDFKVRVPKQYDAFLKKAYGNYWIKPTDKKILESYKKINSNTMYNKKNNMVLRFIYGKKFN